MSLKKEITFRAPTGSGKTYMMADFMNRIIAARNDIVFLVSSLSKGDLARQNYEKFCDYSHFANLKPFLINSEIAGEERLFIPASHNVYVLPRDLYKAKSRIKEQGIMFNFLWEMRMNGKIIVLIKDECHIATSNLDDLAMTFDKIINFSATPKLSRGQNPDVEITNAKAEEVKLIKTVEWGKCTWNGDEKDDTVEDALDKFQNIKEQYRDLLKVNPCLIIQISNKDKADDEWNNVILPALNKNPDLKWIYIVDKEKDCNTNDTFKAKKLPVSKWKDYAKENTASIDVIIFKMVITEGWDIPRACMLYQLRDSKSKQLDEQVIGRVRRNPRLLDFENLSQEAQELAMTSWVWGIKGEDAKKIHGVKLWDEPSDIISNINVKITKLKPLAKKEGFDLASFIASRNEQIVHKSIFELAKKLRAITNDVRDMIYDYADSYQKWWQASEFADDIEKESNQYKYDYEQSMEVVDEPVSFAITSHYTDNGNYVKIGNWVWKRRVDSDKFSFDSEAERDWAETLKDLSHDAIDTTKVGKIKRNGHLDGSFDLWGNEVVDERINEKEVFLWGKNYVSNSSIKFEYYMGALHLSYPDFVMKDKRGRIHIFEVKSVNESSLMSVDRNLYNAKAIELKKCYKQASKITEQIFYLPVLKDDVWQITQFVKGEERTLTKMEFEKFVMLA